MGSPFQFYGFSPLYQSYTSIGLRCAQLHDPQPQAAKKITVRLGHFPFKVDEVSLLSFFHVCPREALQSI